MKRPSVFIITKDNVLVTRPNSHHLLPGCTRKAVLALAAEKKGDLKRARELWQEIARDGGSPQGALQRAQALLALTGPAEPKTFEVKPAVPNPAETKTPDSKSQGK